MKSPKRFASLAFFALVSLAQLSAGEIRVHRYTSSEKSYEANAFWLESASGLVLVDTLMLKSDANCLAAAMKSTSKPLLGIFITHPHVDHFGGIRTILAAFGDVPVIATKATADNIRPVHEQGLAQGWLKDFGSDYEQEVFIPNRILESGAELQLAGMHFEIRDFGPMEADNNSLILNKDLNVLFVGDALVADAMYYIGSARSGHAIEQLHKIAQHYKGVKRVYCGHFTAANLEEVTAQNIQLLETLRKLIMPIATDPSQFTAEGRLKKEVREALLQQLVLLAKGRPDYGFDPHILASYNLALLVQEFKPEREAKKP